jgi:hypothetical protein
MTSDNTTRSPAPGEAIHVHAAGSARERSVATLLPKRTIGGSFWPGPDRPVASPPRPGLLAAVLDGLRGLDCDRGRQ